MLKQQMIALVKNILDFFDWLDNHVFGGFLLLIGIIVAFLAVKYIVNRQIGKAGKDKEVLELILATAIPKGVEYFPVYAYKRERIGRHGMRCWDYAIGMAQDRMYIVSLSFENKEMEGTGVVIYRRDELAQIGIVDSNFKGTCHNVSLWDKKDTPFMQFNVDEVVVKLDKHDYVNIHQQEEVKAFIERLETWKSGMV